MSTSTPKLKDVIANSITSTLRTANDVIPLAGVTLTTTLVAANSWIAEFVNEEANFTHVNKLKAQMLGQTTSTSTPPASE